MRVSAKTPRYRKSCNAGTITDCKVWRTAVNGVSVLLRFSGLSSSDACAKMAEAIANAWSQRIASRWTKGYVFKFSLETVQTFALQEEAHTLFSLAPTKAHPSVGVMLLTASSCEKHATNPIVRNIKLTRTVKEQRKIRQHPKQRAPKQIITPNRGDRRRSTDTHGRVMG